MGSRRFQSLIAALSALVLIAALAPAGAVAAILD